MAVNPAPKEVALASKVLSRCGDGPGQPWDFQAVDKRVSVHDLHATILNQMGQPLSFSSESSGEPQTVGRFA